VQAGDAPGQARADAAVGVADASLCSPPLPRIDEAGQRGIEARGQPVRRRLQGRRAAIRGGMRRVALQQARQVDVDVFAGRVQRLFQQVGAAHRFVQRTQAERASHSRTSSATLRK
jgi:hypothetical protein